MSEKVHLSGAKSSLKNETFALNSISEMFKIGSIKEVQTPPKLITTLSVSENSLGKKHLILDLRYINEHTKTRLNSMIRIFLKITQNIQTASYLNLIPKVDLITQTCLKSTKLTQVFLHCEIYCLYSSTIRFINITFCFY